MKDAPGFDFYPERWTQGTRDMTKVERCDYLDLLGHQWTEGALPSDLNAVARILGYTKASQIPAAVLDKFPVGEDGRRRNLRLEIIREQQRQRITKRREGAAITNAKRWGNKIACESLSDRSATRQRVAIDAGSDVAIDVVSDSPPPTTHHPPCMGDESPKPPLVGSPPTGAAESASISGRGFRGYSPEFERLWQAYPRKTGKGAAWAAWQRIRQRPDIETLVSALTAQSRSVKWTEEDGRFIPHPATWLNQRRWDDDLFSAPPSAPPPDPTKRSWE